MPKIVGLVRSIALSIALLYQLTDKCGTLGGLRLNEPEIEKCGSLMLGNFNVNLLNADLIAFNPFVTTDFALFIVLEIVVLIPLKMLVTEAFTAFSGVVIAVLIALNTLVTVDLMLLTTDVITD